MRDIGRNHYGDRPRPILRRSADGRLKSAHEELEVADIWAEQKRIQLAEAITRDRAKAAKKHHSRRDASLSHTKQSSNVVKEIEVHISFPSTLEFVRRMRQRMPSLAVPHLSIRQWIWGAIILFLCIFVVTTQSIYKHNNGQSSSGAIQAQASKATAPGGTQPSYPTVLPTGKTIQQLGGWGRVSPPDKNPVFAYSDTLSKTHIVVSEQPMPTNYQSDLSQIAKQFNATQKLTMADGSIAFIATGASGSQSIVTSKNDLLLLLRSSGNIANQIWVDYISTLQ